MENGVVTVLYFFTLFYGKQEGNPSSHFMTFGTPSFLYDDESKSKLAQDLDDRLQSRNVPSGTSGD